jgi:hypothetical protein
MERPDPSKGLIASEKGITHPFRVDLNLFSQKLVLNKG